MTIMNKTPKDEVISDIDIAKVIKYDNYSWHINDSFPLDLSKEAALTHMGWRRWLCIGRSSARRKLGQGIVTVLCEMKFYHEIYEYNKNRDTFLYSDRMIYSPAVCFLRMILIPYYQNLNVWIY